MSRDVKPPPELRACDEVLEQIRETLSRAEGVQGFTVTVRTEKATIQIKWGDHRIRRNWPRKDGAS